MAMRHDWSNIFFRWPFRLHFNPSRKGGGWFVCDDNFLSELAFFFLWCPYNLKTWMLLFQVKRFHGGWNLDMLFYALFDCPYWIRHNWIRCLSPLTRIKDFILTVLILSPFGKKESLKCNSINILCASFPCMIVDLFEWNGVLGIQQI